MTQAGVPVGELAGAGATPSPVPPPAPKSIDVSYRGFHFWVNETLATAVHGEAVDALSGRAGQLNSPEYVRFSFDGQAPSLDFNPRQPQLLIFPAQAYAQVSPSAGKQVNALQELITGRAVPKQGALPLLPVSLQPEVLHAQPRFLTFNGGSGIRYIARYSQSPNTGTGEELFYTFQGLSSDGEYYIAFFYPVDVGALPLAGTPPGGTTTAEAGLAGTASATAAQLERLAETGFEPNLIWLDALVSTLSMPETELGLHESQPPKVILETLRGKGLPELRSLWDTLMLGPQDIFDPQAQLNVDLFDLEVNGSRDEYQILVISDEAKENWQYLVFRAVGVRWWFSGSIDLPFQAFVPPGYQILGDGRDAWLVVDWLSRSGADITRYEEGWFLLSHGQLKQTLKYPTEGFQMSPEAPYNVRYRAAPEVSTEASGFVVRLPFSITYSIYGDGTQSANKNETYDLFSMQREAVYRWRPDPGLFGPVAARTNLTQAQVDADFYFAPPAGDFVSFAGSELSMLARSGGSLQKRWLKQYLSGLESSPEIEQILKTMGG